MKGLHKDYLRKGDNPHQWMIDDARMELIQQIKAEVERRIKRNREEYAPDGLFEVQDNLAKLLSFLSDLEKEEKPIEGLDEDVKSWFFNEISSKINVEHTMYYYFQECARRYYELGRQSKPKVSEEDEVNIGWLIAYLKGDNAGEYYDEMMRESLADWLENRFKSLRPSWKPSEEQMKALERTIHIANFGLEVDRRKALESLYEELKKL